jgi:hypothetical protein
MTLEDFYAECAAILECDHVGEAFTHYKRTRWNNRTPGRGRFPGRGIIRVFGNQVHIALTYPQPVSKIVQGMDEALAFLRSELVDVGV